MVTNTFPARSVMYVPDIQFPHAHTHIQINDPACISRLTAFSEDAERLMSVLLPTHVLKISNLRFMVIEKQFKGACTSPLEFRADRQTTVLHGDELAMSDDAPAAATRSMEVPPNTPRYVSTTYLYVFIHSTTIADVLERNVVDGEFQIMAAVKTVSGLFPGKRMLTPYLFIFTLRVQAFHDCRTRRTLHRNRAVGQGSGAHR